MTVLKKSVREEVRKGEGKTRGMKGLIGSVESRCGRVKEKKMKDTNPVYYDTAEKPNWGNTE